MGAGFVSGVGVVLAAAAITAAPPTRAATPGTKGSFPLIELRQYTLHDGQRDTLIHLFEREFIEPQEAQGIKVIGTFIDLDRPNRFVWLRGFRDMDSRLAGLTAFYGGPVWQAHRNEANATMVDSDNVLLLHAPKVAAEFELNGERPADGQREPSGLVVVVIDYLEGSPGEVLPVFEAQVKPRLEKAGIPLLAWFKPETAPNNFHRLPVREGEQVLVWFAAFDSPEDYAARKSTLADAAQPLAPWVARAPEVLRLQPTGLSLLRGAPDANPGKDDKRRRG